MHKILALYSIKIFILWLVIMFNIWNNWAIAIDIICYLISYISIHFINISTEFLTDWNNVLDLFIQKRCTKELIRHFYPRK